MLAQCLINVCYRYFHAFYIFKKYGKEIFIKCVHYWQISIPYTPEVLIRFAMGTPYIFDIDMMKSGCLGMYLSVKTFMSASLYRILLQRVVQRVKIKLN